MFAQRDKKLILSKLCKIIGKVAKLADKEIENASLNLFENFIFAKNLLKVGVNKIIPKQLAKLN